ncbi:MAG TPA: endopeptidase La [candidate division Zixibacteria bacterium]|nr:endopeptidase La [candidate division Zixibacteria bacterium]
MSRQKIIQSEFRLPRLAVDKSAQFPVLRLQTAVLFPETLLTIRVRRKESLQLLDDCAGANRRFVATYSPETSGSETVRKFYQVGQFARVRDSRDSRGGSRLITIEGLGRAAIDEIVSSRPYLVATASELQQPRESQKLIRSHVAAIMSMVGDIIAVDPTYSLELLHGLRVYRDHPSHLADQVAASMHFSLEDKQGLLEACELRLRFERLIGCLSAELDRLTSLRVSSFSGPTSSKPKQAAPLTESIETDASKSDGDIPGEIARIKQFAHEAEHIPPEVKARVTIEVDRIRRLSPASAEYGLTKNYLDWLMSLPWGRVLGENYEIAEVEKQLNAEYFGPRTIRDQVLQRLAVRRLLSGTDESPVLCLVGAPGTGKASLAKIIAKGMGKELIRLSVGGVTDISEIKGTPRTFLGAMPGKMIRALKDAKSLDPVVLIEDVDYFNVDNDAAVNQSLLEVVDYRYNSRYLDEYIGLPIDLSKVLFICSVRSFEEIPEQFVPRFELLEIPGYIEREKTAIAKRHLIPKLLKKHGILKSEFRVADKTISRIINSYTQESGLLGLSQQMEKICRRVALEKVEHRRKTWTVSEDKLETYLGPAMFVPEKAGVLPEIGLATGLAWTGSGGDLMFIEGLKMKGEGRITTTGSLGEVMRESIQAAHSYVRSKADMLGIDSQDFNEFDIHIHFPSGAIPKDGPSAGVTVCLVVASIMSERPIRNDIAMTGEVTLRGRVLPVGGIKEKVSAAFRTGIHHVAMPKENAKDIKELPREVLRKTKFTFIERVDELFELCLMDFTPSSFTLEKIFAEEIAKAKKKAQRSKRKSTTSSRKRSAGKAARSRKND